MARAVAAHESATKFYFRLRSDSFPLEYCHSLASERVQHSRSAWPHSSPAIFPRLLVNSAPRAPGFPVALLKIADQKESSPIPDGPHRALPRRPAATHLATHRSLRIDRCVAAKAQTI